MDDAPDPDVLSDERADPVPGPAARSQLRESMSLAFVTALQRLPARERSALLLHDVGGFAGGEVARMLGTSVASVNRLVRRARAVMKSSLPDGSSAPLPGSPEERELVAGFVAAHERGDVAGVIALLTDDAVLTMRPESRVYRGRGAIGAALSTVPGDGHLERLRGVLARANGQPAIAWYLDDPEREAAQAMVIDVLTLRGHRISAITAFNQPALFDRFGLPPSLPGRPR